MQVASGNRINIAFLVRLMFILPAICPRNVECLPEIISR